MTRRLQALGQVLLALAMFATRAQMANADGPAVALRPTPQVERPAVATRPGQEVPAIAPADSPLEGILDGDSQDVVYLAPKFPVFIRLHVQIDGRAFRKLRDGFSEKLFKSLDVDKNGVLDVAETKQVPPPAQLAPVRPDGQPLRQFLTNPVDNYPKDGKVTLEELQRYVQEAGGTPFEITSITPQNRIETNLFERLDVNKDGRLTPDEISNARGRLWKNDLNDDELVSNRELAPAGADFSNRFDNNSSGSMASLLMVIEPGNPSPTTIRRMLNLYDKFAKDPSTGFFAKDTKLTVEELGLRKEVFSKFDANRSGKLENPEIGEMLRNPVPQLELLVRLTLSGMRSAEFKILAQHTAGIEGSMTTRTENDQSIQVTLGGVPMDLEMANSTNNEFDLVGFYDMNFKGADGDNNGYLQNTEAENLGIPTFSFRAVDRDGDGKIFKKELLDYVAQQVQLAQSRTTVNLANTSKTLFDLLDDNGDTRLSIREFRAAARQLLSWDKNGDGTVEKSEIPRNMQMAFGSGQANVFGRNPQQFLTQSMDGSGRRSRIGPTWFLKMDRNRDGDLSSREFLGPPELFNRLDADHDGLINPKEAAAAKTTRSARTSTP